MVYDVHPGAEVAAQAVRQPCRRTTGDALPGRPAEGKIDARLRKRNKRGDWRQARKPFLSDLPEVDADIPYRVNLVVLGVAANQVVRSACGSAAARSLVAKPQQEARAAGADFLADVLSAAAATATAGEDHAADLHRLDAANDDRCLCKVSGGPVAGSKLAKLVVAGPVLGEDPASAIQDQLRALKELVELLRVRTPTKLRPVRAVMLCSLAEDGSLSELHGAEARKWQYLVSEFEEENGKLWKFGPVDASDKEEVHATFTQMASARVSSPCSPHDGRPEDPEAVRPPGELSQAYGSETSQTQQKASQDLLPTLTGITPSVRSSKTSTAVTVEQTPNEQVFFDVSAADAAHLASLIDQATAAMDKQSSVTYAGASSGGAHARTPTID